jgi:hypothetical protein
VIYDQKCTYIGLHVKYCYCYQSLLKLEFSRHIFEKKTSNIEFHENPSSKSRVVLYGRTDGHDEANTRSSQFYEKAPQKINRAMSKRLISRGIAEWCHSSLQIVT